MHLLHKNEKKPSSYYPHIIAQNMPAIASKPDVSNRAARWSLFDSIIQVNSQADQQDSEEEKGSELQAEEQYG